MTSELLEIEALRQLKARYFRLMDEKCWDEWRQVFCDDFSGVFRGPHPEVLFHSGDEIVSVMREMLKDAVTVHHGHTPEIQLLSATRATGIWAMMDYVQMGEQHFRGYGHYYDQYRREDDGWRILHTELRRLHIQPLGAPAGGQ